MKLVVVVFSAALFICTSEAWTISLIESIRTEKIRNQILSTKVTDLNFDKPNSLVKSFAAKKISIENFDIGSANLEILDEGLTLTLGDIELLVSTTVDATIKFFGMEFPVSGKALISAEVKSVVLGLTYNLSGFEVTKCNIEMKDVDVDLKHDSFFKNIIDSMVDTFAGNMLGGTNSLICPLVDKVTNSFLADYLQNLQSTTG